MIKEKNRQTKKTGSLFWPAKHLAAWLHVQALNIIPTMMVMISNNVQGLLGMSQKS